MAIAPLPPRLPETRRANLRRLLAPRGIAFVGGRQIEGAIRAIRELGFPGRIHAVNATRAEIAGVPCLSRIADLPEAPDAVFLTINADATITALHELRAMGTGGVICFASGFSEIGAAGEERNRRLIAAAGDMAVVGPNCYGLVNYITDGSMWPSGYQASPGRRGAAVIGQSGNVCIHLTANQRSVPFSYVISAGNQAVLGFEDYIDVLVDDPAVTCIGLFMEGIRDVAAFSQACLRARAAGMPVIVCRSGLSELGAAMAASHTSSLAGQNEAYDALFERLGVIATETVPRFLEMLKLASAAPVLPGRRLAVFSSSGGDNGLAADACSFAGLALPPPEPAQVGAIRPLLPDFAHVSNPLDFTAGYWGNEALLTPMFTTMLAGGVDGGVMVMDHPPPAVSPGPDAAIMAMLRALVAAGRATGKPVFMASVNPESIPLAVRLWMLERGVVPLQGLHDAAPVLARWAGYCARRAGDAATGRLPAAPLAAANTVQPRRTVNEAEAKRRLAAHGLAVPQGRILAPADIDRLPDRLPRRMVLKVLDDRLPHKTEVDGVALDLETRAEVQAAAARINRGAAAQGVVPAQFLFEPMQPAPLAELIVGVKRDPLFGLVLVLGAGGILVELLKDARPLILPVDRAEVEAALRALRVFPLLDGFRGRPRARIAPVVDAVMAVAACALAEADRLVELDVNPLFVHADGAVAVDALIVEG
jgi:acyl-CoA synthetase (NDP forming)